jgi:hypothetical protein
MPKALRVACKLNQPFGIACSLFFSVGLFQRNASFLERQVSTFNLTHGFKSLLTYYRNNRVPQTDKVVFAFNAATTNAIVRSRSGYDNGGRRRHRETGTAFFETPVDARLFHRIESANLLLAKTGGTACDISSW